MTHMGDVLRRIEAVQLRCDCGPDGNVMSDTAIVAEAPGTREVVLRSPLVGGSGQLVWKVLRKYNVTRNQVYITNVVKRALTNVDSAEKVKVAPTEQQHWEAILRWELCQLPNLRYVILLGDMALNALTGHDGITSWRGSVFDGDITWQDVSGTTTKRVTFICANNPAAVLRPGGPSETVFHMDLGRYPVVRNGDWVPHRIEALINPTPEIAISWIQRMRGGGMPVAYDIETMGGETACVGLTNDPHVGMCINWRDHRDNRWTLEEERAVRLELQGLFADQDVQFVAQNGNFDSYWLWFKDRIRVHRNWFDTMLAHHWLYPSLPHGLGFLCTQYTTHPYYKDEAVEWREGGNINQFWEYNVKDVCITIACQRYLLRELREAKMERGFFEHVMRLQPHLVRMTVGGVRIDVQEKNRITESLREQIDLRRFEWENRVRAITGDPNITCNPGSSKQLGDLLFNRLGLVGYGRSTEKANRNRIKVNPRTPPEAVDLLTFLDTLKEEEKFESTYASMTLDDDGRFRCEYKQMGVKAAPGRLSSSKTMWGTGMNGQNMPQRAYGMFMADQGYTLLYCDGSQAEARVVGWVAEIPTWMEQFERARLDGSYDCHRALAAEMFHVPYDEVPTFDRDEAGQPTMRFIAKRCRHGLNYRMGIDKLAEVTGMPRREAERVYNAYHHITPELGRWWRATEGYVRTTKTLVSPYGRRLIFLDTIDEDALTSIIAFVPQSTVGDHVCRAIYMSHEDPEWPDTAAIRMNTHDGLISLVPFEHVVRCARIIKRHAEHPIPIKGRQLIIPFEFKVGMPGSDGRITWSSLKGANSDEALAAAQDHLLSLRAA